MDEQRIREVVREEISTLQNEKEATDLAASRESFERELEIDRLRHRWLIKNGLWFGRKRDV